MTAPPARPSSMTTIPPELDEREAAALALRIFGVAGTAYPLPSERDRNFRLAAEDGQTFVLKVTNAAEEAAVSDVQTRALLHIEHMAPELPVPRVRPSLSGAHETTVRIAAGSRHVVRLLTYLDGEPLGRTAPSPAQAASLGAMLARLGLALRGFRHPAARHDLLWDLKGAARLRPHLAHVAEDDRRLCERGLARFEDTIRPRLGQFRSQVVHNDVNPHNILVDPRDPTRITGVIDFGDMVETQLVNDVAVAAAYQVDSDDPLGRVLALVAAYDALVPLHPDERDALFDLIVLRQVMSVVIAGWRAALYPDNAPYILRHQPRAAAALRALDRLGRAEGTARIRQACAGE